MVSIQLASCDPDIVDFAHFDLKIVHSPVELTGSHNGGIGLPWASRTNTNDAVNEPVRASDLTEETNPRLKYRQEDAQC